MPAIYPSGDIQTVNSPTVSRISKSNAAALPDGGYAVVWYASTFKEVRLRSFDADGTPRGPESVVLTGLEDHIEDSSLTGIDKIAALPNGDIAILMTGAKVFEVAPGFFSNNPKFFTAVVNPVTGALRGAVAMPSVTAERDDVGFGWTGIAPLAGSGFTVVWRESVYDEDRTFQGTETLLQVFSATGAPGGTGPEVLYPPDLGSVGVRFRTLDLNRLEDARTLITLQAPVRPDPSTDSDAWFRYQTFGGGRGDIVPPDVVYSLSDPVSMGAPVLVPLAGGGYVAVVSWFAEAEGGGSAVHSIVYREGAVEQDSHLTGIAGASPVFVSAVALKDGGYVAVIQNLGEPGRPITLRRFAADGRKVGDDLPFDADLTAAIGTSPPDFVATDGGNLTMVWEDTGLAGGVGALTLRTPVWGTPGVDLLTDTGRFNEMYGLGGNDKLVGLGGADEIYGGLGRDRLFGNFGADIIEGGGGNDTIKGGNGQDLIDGGPGHDDIFGGAHDDVVYGGPGNDSILGEGGHDALDGNEGDDSIEGGRGKDTIHGGAGEDSILGGTWRDRIFGDDGDDAISAGFGNDFIDGGDGSDILFGDKHADTILGGKGSDIINAGEGEDKVLGGPGHDLIFGGAAFDVLDGGWGDDSIEGNRGSDNLFANLGDDTLKGGPGVDGFYFVQPFGTAIIRDFDVENEALVFDPDAGEIVNRADFLAAARQVGSDVVYDRDADGKGVIRLKNVDLSDLTEDSFVFFDFDPIDFV